MSEQHASGQDHGDGVGLVGTHNVLTNVSASRLEEGVFLSDTVSAVFEFESRGTHSTNVATGNDTGSTDESGTDV